MSHTSSCSQEVSAPLLPSNLSGKGLIHWRRKLHMWCEFIPDLWCGKQGCNQDRDGMGLGQIQVRPG